MPQFLVSVQHPINYDGSLEGEDMIRDIQALNLEMIAADARLFAGGLEPAIKAKSVRRDANGNIIVTDGPFTEAKEYIGGFWILEAADMNDALMWARKATVACRVPIEVRAFISRPSA